MEAQFASGERTALRLHLHWMMVVQALMLPATIAAAILLIDLAVGDHIPGAARVTVALLTLAVLGAWAVEAWAAWVSATLTVTDRRVTLKQGITLKQTKVIPIDRLSSMLVRQSILGQLLGYGTVEVAAPGISSPARLPFIPNPQRLVDEMLGQLHHQDS